MDAIRLRLFALARYRYAPYLLTILTVLLWSAGLQAAEEVGDEGWNCFVCGCSWMGTHFLPPPYGCWWPPFFTNCWVHPGEICRYINV